MAMNLDDYFRSTFEDKLLVKMPEREDDYLTPATRLLEKRREMSEVEQALSSQKEEFQMKMESLQQRREELERKEHQLKESLLKFDKFLLENDSKRARAIKKSHDERELRKQKEKDIVRLKGDIQTLTEERERYQKKLERNGVFQKYMESVQEATDEFSEVREIMARYDTLVATHVDLLERDQQNQDAIEMEKSRLARFTEEKNNEVLNCNNQLAELQMRLDVAQSKAVKWESKWAHIQNTAAKRTLLLGRIKIATHNLYQLVNKHLKQPAAHAEHDTLSQLDKIQTFIQDLSQITQEIKRIEAAQGH